MAAVEVATPYRRRRDKQSGKGAESCKIAIGSIMGLQGCADVFTLPRRGHDGSRSAGALKPIVVYWVYVGVVEQKMEATNIIGLYRVYIGLIPTLLGHVAANHKHWVCKPLGGALRDIGSIGRRPVTELRRAHVYETLTTKRNPTAKVGLPPLAHVPPSMPLNSVLVRHRSM